MRICLVNEQAPTTVELNVYIRELWPQAHSSNPGGTVLGEAIQLHPKVRVRLGM